MKLLFGSLPEPRCADGADALLDPDGCRGARVPGYEACLAHVDPAGRADYLTGLAPGDDVDHSGTVLSRALLRELLAALCDPATGKARFGSARFARTTFAEETRFEGVTFEDRAEFDDATFAADTSFAEATFAGTAEFGDTTFAAGVTFYGANLSNAWFVSATFTDLAHFSGVTFVEDTDFIATTFLGTACFDRATFTAPASFSGTRFHGETRFHLATFAADAGFDHTVLAGPRLGALTCRGRLDLSRAVFARSVTIEAEAASVRCVDTTWEAPATLRLRSPDVDLSDAVLEHPLTVTGAGDPGTRVVSLRGVDAGHLVLTDLDLSDCLFTGTVRLDRLRTTGRIRFARTPAGRHRRGGVPTWWTSRSVLAEERHRRGWAPGPDRSGPDPGPADLAPLYRDLRKAFEAGGNTSDAADFRYGESEMRRHDPDRPRAERALLTAYWALSGYGLRASRALAWLGLTMLIAIVTLAGYGLPAGATGRTSTATRITLDALVLRTEGSHLTTVGTCVETAVRLLEPALLVLAALAARARVRR
ncbi:pentapeptide repeat-containing protein [Embleya sp. NPDC001921]